MRDEVGPKAHPLDHNVSYVWGKYSRLQLLTEADAYFLTEMWCVGIAATAKRHIMPQTIEAHENTGLEQHLCEKIRIMFQVQLPIQMHITLAGPMG